MALTLANLKTFVTHDIPGGASSALPNGPDGSVAGLIVNQAGRHLYGVRQWKFRETVSDDLDLTISQSYIAMPSNFGQLIGVEANSLTTSIRLVTIAELLQLRARNVSGSTFNYAAAFVQPRRAAVTTPPTPPRLEIFPTPAATVTDGVKVFYRAAWTELTDDTHVPDIPLWCESLLIQYVRAFAEGYDNRYGEESSGIIISLENRLNEIEQGPVFLSAVNEDAGTQPDYGVVSGGAAEIAESHMALAGGGGFLADPWSQDTPFIT